MVAIDASAPLMDLAGHLMPRRIKNGIDVNATYDLNIAILTHCTGGNILRISAMRKYGILNPDNLRIHIAILGNPGDYEYLESFSDGWCSDADVTILEMTSRHPIPKINGYYLWLKDSGLNARWHGRVDDDSITDVRAGRTPSTGPVQMLA